MQKLLTITILSLTSLVAIDFLLGSYVGRDYQGSRDEVKRYFEYGVSTLGKLETLTGNTGGDIASIARAGWYENSVHVLSKASVNCSDQKAITFYGMSFTNRVAEEMTGLSECLRIRTVAGPGSPLSHVYDLYLQDRDHDSSDYVVIGVLASSLPKILSASHMTLGYEYPASLLYPRFRIVDDHLSRIDPPVNSADAVKNLLSTIQGVELLEVFLRNNDYFYDPLVFNAAWADGSLSARLVRRAWAQRQKNLKLDTVFDGKTFVDTQQLRGLAKLLLSDFVGKVKEDGKEVVVLLLNDRGYANSLDELYAQELQTLNVKVVTTSELFDSRNSLNFEQDGHYVPENDLKIAQKLFSIL